VEGEAVEEGAPRAARARDLGRGAGQRQGRLDGVGLGEGQGVGLVVAGEVGVAAGEDAGRAPDDARGDRLDLGVGRRGSGWKVTAPSGCCCHTASGIRV
jgi:hypothetical protein